MGQGAVAEEGLEEQQQQQEEEEEEGLGEDGLSLDEASDSDSCTTDGSEADRMLAQAESVEAARPGGGGGGDIGEAVGPEHAQEQAGPLEAVAGVITSLVSAARAPTRGRDCAVLCCAVQSCVGW